MNREQFIDQLNRSLRRLPNEERLDIVQDFQEHFDIGLEKGKTEEEIAASLGSPAQIAKELLAVHYLDKAEAKTSAGNLFRAAWAAVGLGFFNIVIVLGPFIGLASLLLSGWAMGLSLLVSPLVVLLNLILSPKSFDLFASFASIGLAGLGILMSIGMSYVSRKALKGFVSYLRYNAKLVKGGLKHE
ncbi:DUF1700 domain-containing protein [Cohnella lubricantis]|uniref:DUF1700 domain-containing protein n=1 Tax=Cohnella lubricantis TaxID=2163172 RepID=A0A841TDK5_9BACL|nr:DUF1700 domain-containing protein [Cohnella lubricantis]MBB6679374.1 DUF1700 domain-containing protein [Cohnella lubricantis]MBP2117456.1 putative membrane protein [Cohnella lubricantis]